MADMGRCTFLSSRAFLLNQAFLAVLSEDRKKAESINRNPSFAEMKKVLSGNPEKCNISIMMWKQFPVPVYTNEYFSDCIGDASAIIIPS